MPSLYPYITKHDGNEWFFSLVLCVYSLGELLGALGFGYMHNYTSTKITLYLSLGLGWLGSALYFMADYFGGDTALWLIFASRTLQGFWTGGEQSIEAAYVSEVVEKKDNIRVNSELGMSAVAGFIFGPVIGLALSFIDIKIGFVNIDAFTAPGYM